MSSKEKPHNGGQWTSSRFHSFVKGALRQASMRWPPKHDVKKRARVSRGIYKCEGCNQEVTASIKVNGKRKNNVHVDHIKPVIDPAVGFRSWDEVIERLFCEADGLQVLCTECHSKVTAEERAIAKQRRQQENNNNNEQ